MEVPPLTAPLQDSHDSHRLLRPGHVHVAGPNASAMLPLLERSRPHSMLGLTSRPMRRPGPQKCQAISTFGPDVCITHLGTGPPSASQLRFWGSTDATSASLVPLLPGITSSFLRTNTKALLRLATALLLPAGFLLQLSHLRTWPLSPAQLCPPTRQGSGLTALLARSKCSETLLRAEAAADKIQVRFRSTRCLSSQQPTGDPCRGAVAFPQLRDTHCDSEMTTACPGSSISTRASLTLAKQPQTTWHSCE